MSISTPSSTSSSSSFAPVLPRHCLSVPVLYELVRGEEQHCRVWLRGEMNQIADPLIDSLFIRLIMSSSSSAVPQSRLTVSELCGLLEGEKVEVNRMLQGEMARLVNTLFERLTNKLRTNEDRSEDARDRAQVGNLLDQVASHNAQSHQPSSHITQPSTSSLNLVAHEQHSNGDELELNTVEIFEVKEEVEDGEETRIIDIEALTEDNQSGAGESRSVETTQQMDCVKQEIKVEFDYEQEIEIKQEEDEEIKVEIKEEEGHDICIKHEYVPAYIKTESSDEDVKEEIKEEYEEEDHDDDCDGCERCVVKREMVSDDDEVDNEDGLIQGGDHNEVDDERYEVTQAHLATGQLLCSPSRDIASASNSTESIFEGVTNLSNEQQMFNTLNEPNERTVTQSGDLFSPSSSTGQAENGTASNELATVSTQHNGRKRKQVQLIRTGKRSKKTVQDGDAEGGDDDEGREDIANEDGEEVKVKVLYLNCTESQCNVKLDSLDHLYDHLLTAHQLSPYRCFASNCNLRFDNSSQIQTHIKQHHSQNTRFLCAVCHKEFDSQNKTYTHWYHHLSGQFKCNLVSDCAEVTNTRNKMTAHQISSHQAQSKQLHCSQVGCCASFVFKYELKRHESTHLNTRPFHCIWPDCSHRTNRRSHLVNHIRVQHFALPKSVKEQKAKNIVDLRDPNQYVRVVAEEVIGE